MSTIVARDELDEYLEDALKDPGFAAAWAALHVPEPSLGGTFAYCPAVVDGQSCKWRTRNLKAYRRHWRRKHAEEAARADVRS